MQNQHKFSLKIWLEHQGKPLIGKGGAQILEQIEKEHSISKAAKKLGMSYRYVWSYIKRVEKTLGKPIVETYRGGKRGGGGAKLTNFGKELLEEYKRLESLLSKTLAEAGK
jgi:molybdate transport system regulatory protein